MGSRGSNEPNRLEARFVASSSEGSNQRRTRPPDRLGARERGFVVRERKARLVPFFWTLVLGFETANGRTISTRRPTSIVLA
jgi:hypothetical protein